jgi:hypothetical protein
MKNFIEDMGITGHLQIAKVYSTGNEEVVFDDHNIIVSGMGVGLAQLFSLSGPGSILDYQIDRFQIGVGGDSVTENVEINALNANLTSLEEYGENAMLYVIEGYHAFSYSNISINREWFGYIPQHKVSKVGDSSVRYTITIDKDAANTLETTRGAGSGINEIGLFMKNPLGDRNQAGYDTSILVAYRKFRTIVKTDDFALVFRWTINW